MKELLDANETAAALDRLYESVLSALPEKARIAVIGIRTRGEILAQRIVERLREDLGDREVDRGVLDITLYRDDLSRRRGVPLVRATEIDFDLDDAWVLLVDDVLETGRSVRAALDAIHDFGRPGAIRLAILIDRGGRQLPIAADFVGQTVSVPRHARVRVRLEEHDGEESVTLVEETA